jgi:hypothetical protein
MLHVTSGIGRILHVTGCRRIEIWLLYM